MSNTSQKLDAQNGLKFRKMGHLPAKVNVEKQEQWLKQELNPVIEKAKKGLYSLFFMDAAHSVLNSYLCAVWYAVRLFIKAQQEDNGWMLWGAVNAISKQIITLGNDSHVNAEVIADFLTKLKKRQQTYPS